MLFSEIDKKEPFMQNRNKQKNFFLKMILVWIVCVCVGMCMSTGIRGDQKRVWYLLELELQAVV